MYSIKAYHTFGTESRAKNILLLEREDQVQQVVEQTKNDFLLLGGGSNVLPVEDLSTPVVVNRLTGVEVVQDTDTHQVWRIGAGESWHSIVQKAVNANLGGIENLALIPGTVGAAPIQNIGAYGVELEEVFVELVAYHRETGQLRTFSAKDCDFSYRYSTFKGPNKGQYIVTSVSLRLNKKHQVNTSYGAIRTMLDQWGISSPSIKDVFQAVVDIRRSKLPNPDLLGNAGSFFKNPIIPLEHLNGLKEGYPDLPFYPAPRNHVKVAAGWLIDRRGWKGHRRGQVGVHEKQALVLVNYGGGTGKEIFQLATDIREDIFQAYGIKLEAEVNFVGKNQPYLFP